MLFGKKEPSQEEQMALLYRAAELFSTNVPLAMKTLEQIPGMKEIGYGHQWDILSVINGLQSEDVDIRYEAATRLGDRAASGKVTQHPLIVAIYLTALRNDLDYGVRSGIAWSLGFMFASDSASVHRVAPSTDLQELVLSSLLHAVQRDPSFRVKQSAAWALGKIKSSKVLNGLKQYLLEIEALPSHMKDGLDVNSRLYTVEKWIKEAIKAIEE